MKKIKLFIGTLLIALIFTGCGNNEEEYLEDLQDLASISYDLAVDSETVGLGYLNVWRDVIYDKNVTIDGYTYTDFNVALSAQLLHYQTSGELDSLNEKMKEVENAYKKIKDTDTKKYQEEFNSVKDFYLKVVEFNKTATEPSGNYNSYSESFQTSRDSIVTRYSSLKVELELEE